MGSRCLLWFSLDLGMILILITQVAAFAVLVAAAALSTNAYPAVSGVKRILIFIQNFGYLSNFFFGIYILGN